MATQTDVKSRYMSATGAMGIGGATQGIRIKGIWVSYPVSGGTVTIKDNGASSGPILIQFDFPAGTGTGYHNIPGEGVRFSGDPYVTLPASTTVTIYYG